MAGSKTTHWGTWIQQRAEFLGFKRQVDFARAAGVSPQHLRRWFALSAPPSRMRLERDNRLVRALRTDRRMLFVEYESVPAAEALVLEWDAAVEVPWGIGDQSDDKLRRSISELIGALRGDDLRAVRDHVGRLLLARLSEFDAKHTSRPTRRAKATRRRHAD
jgi:hypothetical protein